MSKTIGERLAGIIGRDTSRRGVAKVTAAALLGGVAVTRASNAPVRAQDATPAGDDSCPTTSEEENIALVQRFTDEVWTTTGGGNVADFYSEATVHNWGFNEPTIGPDAFSQRRRVFLDAFPDFALRIDEAIADGDFVVTRYTATGTQEAAWLGIESTGAAVEYGGIQIVRIECGQIAESWGAANHLNLIEQLGGLPGMTSPEATPTT
ncbi:MAG: ester cyclase [Chloroflexota bacterium]|nr:ester cyclase [Chloroflexota bacterium]